MKCPSCGVKVNGEFGMITCSQCSTMFMVEMDGTVQKAPPAGSQPEPYEDSPMEATVFHVNQDVIQLPPPAATPEVIQLPPPAQEDEAEAGSDEAGEFASEVGEDASEEPVYEDEVVAEEGAEYAAEETPAEEGVYEEEAPAEEPVYEEEQPVEEYVAEDYAEAASGEADETVIDSAISEEFIASEESEGQPLEEVAEETEYSENFMDDINNPPPQELGEADPMDIAAFGESPLAQTPDGLYYYDIKISALDSGQLRYEVVRALSDARFGWTPEELKKKVYGGELKLENLNPVTAVLVVIKLQPFDVEVEWEQKLYTAVPVAENDNESEAEV